MRTINERGFPLFSVALLLAACGSAASTTPAAPLPTATPTALLSTVLNVQPEDSTVAFTTTALGGRLQVEGSYGVLGGQVILTPEEGQLRVTALVLIDTPSITVRNTVVDEAMKLAMETGAYPVATFSALSTTLVPVTEEPVEFILAGTLTLHGQTQPVTMIVSPATVIHGHMDARAAMNIDLADFGIMLPEAVVSSAISLDVTLIADVNAPPRPSSAE